MRPREGGLRHWTQVDCNQPHHQLPREGGPAWDTVVRRATLDSWTRKIISDDYRPQNYCLGVPTSLSRSGRRHDVVTIFHNYADGRKPDSRAVMSQPAVPRGQGPSSLYTPAGPAGVIADCFSGAVAPDAPAPRVPGPK